MWRHVSSNDVGHFPFHPDAASLPPRRTTGNRESWSKFPPKKFIARERSEAKPAGAPVANLKQAELKRLVRPMGEAKQRREGSPRGARTNSSLEKKRHTRCFDLGQY